MFTGKERDAETGLDYMDFRYYGSPMGRFLSPDPLMASANVGDPQSWNRYVYARNNPLRYNDPLGLFPSPAYNCSDTQTSCLNDEQRRILENSSVKVGKETLSGEKLWSALTRQDDGEAIQNAFVNITDKLGSITLEGGGTALSQVSGLTDMKVDRLHANVSSGLAGALAGSSAFKSVSAGDDHAPFNAISYKNVADVRGNIQFSFNESRRGADIDIDLGNMASKNPLGPLIHIGEVLQNKITNTKTSQDAVRNILMANPSVMITPSPDPKWNRK
jgi:RHS repeat-associated protein